MTSIEEEIIINNDDDHCQNDNDGDGDDDDDEEETETGKNDHHQQPSIHEKKLDFTHPDIHHNKQQQQQKCLSPTQQTTNPIMLITNPLLHIQQRQKGDHRSLAQQALINRALRNRRHTLANVNR